MYTILNLPKSRIAIHWIPIAKARSEAFTDLLKNCYQFHSHWIGKY